MNTDDMRKLYEGLKIIFEDQTPGEKESPNGNQEASSQEGKETGQEEASSKETPANRVPENEPSPAEDGQRPDPGAEPSPEPTGGAKPNPGSETPTEPDANKTGEETSGPQEETSDGEEDGSSKEEKEDFHPEEITQAVTIAGQLGLPEEPVKNLFSLIDRDKLVNNKGEIGEEELTDTLKLLEAIVLRKPAKTPTEPNYNYDPENARQSTGFGKYL